MKFFFVFSDDKRTEDVRSWLDWIARTFDGGHEGRASITKDATLADVIVVVGGDGTMLHAIHNYHILGLPFLGIDRGTMGFNLNPADTKEELFYILGNYEEHMVLKLHLVSAIMILKDGSLRQHLAFNDVYAKSDKIINGRVVSPGECGFDYYFRADGIIIATPQGSTAYSRAAGGKVIPLEDEFLAVTTICPQSRPIQTVTKMDHVFLSLNSRSDISVHVDSLAIDKVADVIVGPSKKTVKLVFTERSNYRLRRFHIEDETENRLDKWMPQNFYIKNNLVRDV